MPNVTKAFCELAKMDAFCYESSCWEAPDDQGIVIRLSAACRAGTRDFGRCIPCNALLSRRISVTMDFVAPTNHWRQREDIGYTPEFQPKAIRGTAPGTFGEWMMEDDGGRRRVRL